MGYRMSKRRRHAQSCRRTARKLLPELVAAQDNKCCYCKQFIVVIRDIPEELFDRREGPYAFFRSLEGDLLFAKFATVEHLKPLAEGGSNRKDNLAASCIRCNQKRRPQVNQ